MKKKIAAFMLTLLSLGVVSCSNASSSSSEGVDAFDPEKQYTLDFLGWGSTSEQKNFQDLIKQFMTIYPNVKVFYEAISDTTAYSTNLLNNANSLPDVFYVPDYDYLKWADSGKLLNLKDYLTDDELNTVWPMSTDMYRYDSTTKQLGVGDDIYGLPKDLGPYTLVYNKDLMKELIQQYNLPISLPDPTTPMTFDQFKTYLEYFKGLKNVNGDKIWGITFYDVQAAVYSNNANFYTDDTATASAITDQNFIDAIQFVADLTNDGLAADVASVNTSSAFSKFAAQESLFTWMGPWDMKSFWEGLDFEFDTVPVCQGVAEGSRSTSWLGSVAYSVSAKSQNKAAAVQLAKWLALSDESATMNYQIGQAMPNVISIAEGDWINNVGLSGNSLFPANKQVFLDITSGTSLTGGRNRAYYYTYSRTAYDDLMDQLTSVWTGSKTAQEVINAYANTFQQNLTTIHENLE